MQTSEINLDALELKYVRLSVKCGTAERKLLTSLSESGQQSPIIVVRGAEAGRYVVIDGHKRVRALRQLKADVARAVVWASGEAEALAASYQITSQGGRNAFEEGWLVAELHRICGWSLGEVGVRLVRSKSWVCKRLALVEELPEWMAEEVCQGRIGAHAAANYLVPLTRVHSAEGRQLAENIRGLGFTNRQIGQLCAGCRVGGREQRRRIVENPALYLKASAAASRDAVLSEKGARCLKNITLIGQISLGLARNLAEAINSEGQTAEQARLGAAWKVCRARFNDLARTAAAIWEAGDAERSDKGGDFGAAQQGQQRA